MIYRINENHKKVQLCLMRHVQSGSEALLKMNSVCSELHVLFLYTTVESVRVGYL